MSHCVFESFQVSFLLTAQLRQSSWRQQIPWETTIALPTPTLKLFSRATALMESKYRSSLCILSSVMTSLNSLTWQNGHNISAVWDRWPELTWPCLCHYRGIILFRPPRLNNKFEDSSVKYTEGVYNSNKIKQFIKDNMWVSRSPDMLLLHECQQEMWFHFICTKYWQQIIVNGCLHAFILCNNN